MLSRVTLMIVSRGLTLISPPITYKKVSNTSRFFEVHQVKKRHVQSCWIDAPHMPYFRVRDNSKTGFRASLSAGRVTIVRHMLQNRVMRCSLCRYMAVFSRV